MATLVEAYRQGLISLRTHNALTVAGHVDIASILTMSDDQLLAVRGIGRTVLAEVRGLASQSVAAEVGDRHAYTSGSDVQVQSVPAGLGATLVRARQAVSSLSLDVLRDRFDGMTLEQIARKRGVTRERIRQVEAKAAKIVYHTLRASAIHVEWSVLTREAAISESRLFEPFIDDDATFVEQIEFGRLAATACGLKPLLGFGDRRIEGWWSPDPRRLLSSLAELGQYGPLELVDLERWAESKGLPIDLPWQEIFPPGAGPLRFHAHAGVWVKSKSQTRDAALAVLSRRGTSMSGDEIFEQVGGARARNVEEQMRRNPRFMQLRPSGDWALVDRTAHIWSVV